MVLAHGAVANAFEFHAHPDVWLMVAVLAGGYWFLVTRVGPSRVPPGRPAATTKQKAMYALGVLFLWVGADWPMHEISEGYLFSIHMVQHTLFSLVAPPLLLLGIPKWIWRIPLSNPRTLAIARAVTRPLVGLVAFNAVVVVTHWPNLVDASLRSAPVHFSVHLVLFTTSMVMWWPVIDPLPEMSRLSAPGKMIYLFLQSILPTVPASFLTFSDGVIYKLYAEAPRLWGIDVLTDQRVAGLIMKLGGGLLLWTAIAIVFFRWSAAEERQPDHDVSWEDFERSLDAWRLRQS